MKTKNKKWKLYLYYDGVLVKKLKIDENEEPKKNGYAVRVYFKKFLFRTNIASVILRPVVLLKNNESEKKTYWGTILEQGVDV